jgi:hypothetical protein
MHFTEMRIEILKSFVYSCNTFQSTKVITHYPVPERVMKLIKILSLLVLLLLIGSFGYFAMSDISVQQQDVSKEIPHDRFADQ